MPVGADNIGRSAVTPDKQYAFGRILAQHLEITTCVLRKHSYYPQAFCYIDAYAGDGGGTREPGSAQIFIDTVTRKAMEFEAHFVDIVAANAQRLLALFGGDSRCHIHEGDCGVIVPDLLAHIPRYAFGLLYCDPNSWADVAMCRLVAKERPKIDILLHLPATTKKRVRCAVARNGEKLPTLADDIRSIDKRKWIVRGPLDGDKQQWIFLLGTNYTNFKAWQKEGFVCATSDVGREIITRANYTKNELERSQATLAGMAAEDEAVLAAVKIRSGGICEVCRDAPAVQVHHKSYPSKDTPENLLHVCHWCHCRIHGVAA